jgi:hypothetical protein
VVVDYFLGLVEKKAKSKAIGTRKKGDTKKWRNYF